MWRLISIILTFAAFAVPDVAQACRVMMSPEQKIAGGYENGAISAVALVKIEQAEHIREPIHDSHPWRARARVLVPIMGDGHFPEHVEFERGHGSAACEWSLPPLPKRGDRWVVYFFTGVEGGLIPWTAFPQTEAASLDPTLPPDLP